MKNDSKTNQNLKVKEQSFSLSKDEVIEIKKNSWEVKK